MPVLTCGVDAGASPFLCVLRGSKNCSREEYNTGMRRYNSAREDSRSKPEKLYMRNRQFFFDISGLISSFWLALCVGFEECVLLQWIATTSLINSICERLAVPRSRAQSHFRKTQDLKHEFFSRKRFSKQRTRFSKQRKRA